MTSPALFIVSYDTRDARRRRRFRRMLQSWSTGHQYSVYEQFPTASECGRLLEDLAQVRKTEDSLWAFRVDPRASRITLGTVRPAAPWEGMILS
jgi:CRISPR-associated endonuclease Cas2